MQQIGSSIALEARFVGLQMSRAILTNIKEKLYYKKLQVSPGKRSLYRLQMSRPKRN